MDYKGKYQFFDFSRIKTYPLAERPNRVKLKDLVDLEKLLGDPLRFESQELKAVAEAVVDAQRHGKPVIWFTGAHAIKNGLSPIVIDLIQRGVITHYASTLSGAIHDFELALIGETSENVPNALPAGKFGTVEETGKYINDAVAHGNKLKLGLGESLARMIGEEKFPYNVQFPHKEVCVIYNAYEKGVPATFHVTIGADITNQHPNFDGEALGGASGRDFGILAASVEKLGGGGVVLNIGSAVTGPEVFLKAMNMAANVGHPPKDIMMADFDIRPVEWENVKNESKHSYYFRNAKSVVTRIPEAFGGKGYYIQGDQMLTIPALYKFVVDRLEAERAD